MLPPSVAFCVFAPAEIKRERNKKDPNHRGESSIPNFHPLVKVFFNIYCGFSGVFCVFCAKKLLNAQHFVYGVLLLFGEYHTPLIWVIVE